LRIYKKKTKTIRKSKRQVNRKLFSEVPTVTEDDVNSEGDDAGDDEDDAACLYCNEL